MVDEGTGNYTFNWSVSFKGGDTVTPGYAALVCSEQPMPYVQIARAGYVTMRVLNASASPTDDNMTMIACFGELENEQ